MFPCPLRTKYALLPCFALPLCLAKQGKAKVLRPFALPCLLPCFAFPEGEQSKGPLWGKREVGKAKQRFPFPSRREKGDGALLSPFRRSRRGWGASPLSHPEGRKGMGRFFSFPQRGWDGTFALPCFALLCKAKVQGKSARQK